MRIDGPKGLGSWLQGFFSGSFKGRLTGTTEVEGPIKIVSDHLHVHGNIIVSGSVAQGKDTVASAANAHAEGYGTKALGVASHAEGSGSIAEGLTSHAEGRGTKSRGVASHAEGIDTETIGLGSHAEGLGTIAAGDFQTVIGKYNVADSADSMLFIIGNGTSDESRSNVLTVDNTGELTVRKLKLQETMSLENVEVGNLVVTGSISSPKVSTSVATASIVLATNVTAASMSASLIEANDIKANTFSISQNLESPILIASEKISAGDIETTDIVGPVVKTSQIVVRQYIYSGSAVQPEVIDRVILEYNSGSGDLDFKFIEQ